MQTHRRAIRRWQPVETVSLCTQTCLVAEHSMMLIKHLGLRTYSPAKNLPTGPAIQGKVSARMDKKSTVGSRRAELT